MPNTPSSFSRATAIPRNSRTPGEGPLPPRTAPGSNSAIVPTGPMRRPSGPDVAAQHAVGIDLAGAHSVAHVRGFGANGNTAPALPFAEARRVVAGAKAGCAICAAFAKGLNVGAATARAADDARETERVATRRMQAADASLANTHPERWIAEQATRRGRQELRGQRGSR